MVDQVDRVDDHAAGALLAVQGDPWAAAVHFGALVAMRPNDAAAHKNLAAMLLEQGGSREQLEEAIGHLKEAVRLAPVWADAHFSLGLALQRGGDHQAAMTQYQLTLGLDPEHAAAHASYLTLTQAICDWAYIDALWDRSRHWLAGPDREPPYALTPLSVVAMPSGAAEQHEAARRWVAAYLPPQDAEPGHQPAATAGPRFGPRRPTRGGRPLLRVGYLSADFRDHPVAHQVVEVIERHDRSRVQVTGYSLGPHDDSALRARITAACDRFIDLSSLPAAEAARHIRDDGTDVLVDLNGWTQGCRPEILALRPAPVQVGFLGYPATTAASSIDYVITDRYLTPPGQQRHWSERFAYLPDCYMPADTRRVCGAVPTRRKAGLPARGVVFCCFNHTAKITPQTFDVWMRLLRAVPHSVLWLVAAHPCAPTQLRLEAEARGVDAGRLVFAGRRDHADYLALYRLADLFLDTWPYAGGATANDALWAGLPVLTLVGETYVSRMAASQLRAVGLHHLVTRTAGGYERRALELALCPRDLCEVRALLARNRNTWPLFDTDRYTRNLEDAYGQMAARTVP